MTTYEIVLEGKRLSVVNTLIFVKCTCGFRATLDLDGPEDQPCQSCQRTIWKRRVT